uniref:Uncharacterized protein n=1 Tax=Megaselia scalaris TaxID=36166 RepID=T1GSA6_MEGSC
MLIKRVTDHRFSRLKKGKGNTDHGNNGKRKNTLHSPLNQADVSFWEVFFFISPKWVACKDLEVMLGCRG